MLKQEVSDLRRLARSVAHERAQESYERIRDALLQEVDSMVEEGVVYCEIAASIRRLPVEVAVAHMPGGA
ncbi:MAG: hypothetical protein R3E87_23600 [Burkholderiaceae bacterium]